MLLIYSEVLRNRRKTRLGAYMYLIMYQKKVYEIFCVTILLND